MPLAARSGYDFLKPEMGKCRHNLRCLQDAVRTKDSKITPRQEECRNVVSMARLYFSAMIFDSGEQLDQCERLLSVTGMHAEDETE